ncbi:MAG TPA: phage virion morphogenesis protein [Candidatus Sulfotelmatobacter sp.]|nr:phage virion morphogenesis protein [Candidatus Sulfotelmatobacter sp.]
MAEIRKVGAWSRVGKLLASAPHRMREAVDKALIQEAQFFRTKIVEGMREQAPGGKAFAPLAPTTLAIRRFRGFKGTKALLVQGDLRNSVTVVKEGDGVFVGVLRSAKGRAGQPLVNVASVHEFGSPPIAVKLTPKARAFLHAAFRRAGLDSPSADHPSTGIAIIKVPARPFFGPVFEKYADPDQVSRRFLERVAKNLGGEFGHP